MIENRKKINELLSASFKGVKKLFCFSYLLASGGNADEEAGIKDNKKYFLARGEINSYNVLIDGRHLYDQPIIDLRQQYNEVRKVSTGQGDD